MAAAAPPGTVLGRAMTVRTTEELNQLAEIMLREGKARSSTKHWARRVLKAAVLSVELIAHCLIGLAVIGLFWAPRRFSPLEFRWHVNTTAKEVPMIDGTHEDPIADILNSYMFDIPLCFFFPVTFALYFDATRKEFAFLFACFLPFALFFRGIAYAKLGMGAAPLIMFGPTLWLRLVLGPGTGLPMASLRCAAILCVAIVLLNILSMFRANTELRKLVTVVCILPIFKESSYIMARRLALHLALSNDIQVRGRQLRRELSWIMHLWVQLFTALTMRIIVTRFVTREGLVIAITLQSVWEVASRLTMIERDRVLNSFIRNTLSFKVRESAIVVPKNLQQSMKQHRHTQSSEEELSESIESFDRRRSVIETFYHAKRSDAVREFCLRHFHSSVVAGEMLCEYFAIALVPLILLLFEHAQLQLPFDQYIRLGFFEVSPLDPGELLRSTLFQFGAEIIVDIFCVFFEERRGYDIASAWHLRPRFFSVLFVWAAWFSSTLTYLLADQRDHFDNCLVDNMCKCAAGNGLHPEGVRQLYCVYVYNVTSGLPPNTTSAPFSAPPP